jgi:hypothetical protein
VRVDILSVKEANTNIFIFLNLEILY